MNYQGKQVLVLGLGESGLAMALWLGRCGAAVRVADTRDAPERLQQLPDGNQIERRTSAASYRDSAGRTRHEVRGKNGEVQVVTIHDPVANAAWILRALSASRARS